MHVTSDPHCLFEVSCGLNSSDRTNLLGIFNAALKAVNGRHCVIRYLSSHPLTGPVYLIAIGKAAASMASGAYDVLGKQIELYDRVVHEAEEGGYWAEVPALPGCATQGETFEELLMHLYEAVEGCLSVDVSPAKAAAGDRVLEIAV